jgi:hypothetical protein
MKKNIYCIVDTETSKMTDVYDLGVIIFDKKGNILFTRNYCNMDVFGNNNMMENAYYNWKMPLYKENKNIVRVDTRSMMYDFLYNLRLYGVTHLLAYNLSFDINALDKTYMYFCNRHFDSSKYILVDIMRVAIETIINTNKYRNFCKKHNEMTDKGNYKSSAETVYRYINNDLNFIESHTALDDCYCEKAIFEKCLKQKKTVSIGCKSNLWKIIQDK